LQMQRVALILSANALHAVGTAEEFSPYVHSPWSRICLRVMNGDFDFQMSKIRTPVPLGARMRSPEALNRAAAIPKRRRMAGPPRAGSAERGYPMSLPPLTSRG
jgi:hypothetical protein